MPPTAAAKLEYWENATTHLKQLGVDLQADNERMKRIEMLTFDEYRRLAQQMEKAPDIGSALSLIDEAFENCTLMSPWHEDKTWAEACEEQRSRIRVP